MRLFPIAFIAVLIAGTLSACSQNSIETAEIKTTIDSVSYAIGLDIGKNLSQQSIEVNAGALARGILDAKTEGKALLTSEQIQAVMMAFQQQLTLKQQEKTKAAASSNKEAGAKFLAENKAKEGVVTLPSGLQYQVIKEGTGPKPKATDMVTVHYRGTLLDGKEFDSSIKRGQPATFPVNGVIKGWTEAMQLMSVGSKWKLFIPSDLAYGENGAGQEIGPNATLIFEVELINVQANPEAGK